MAVDGWVGKTQVASPPGHDCPSRGVRVASRPPEAPVGISLVERVRKSQQMPDFVREGVCGGAVEEDRVVPRRGSGHVPPPLRADQSSEAATAAERRVRRRTPLHEHGEVGPVGLAQLRSIPRGGSAPPVRRVRRLGLGHAHDAQPDVRPALCVGEVRNCHQVMEPRERSVVVLRGVVVGVEKQDIDRGTPGCRLRVGGIGAFQPLVRVADAIVVAVGEEVRTGVEPHLARLVPRGLRQGYAVDAIGSGDSGNALGEEQPTWLDVRRHVLDEVPRRGKRRVGPQFAQLDHRSTDVGFHLQAPGPGWAKVPHAERYLGNG